MISRLAYAHRLVEEAAAQTGIGCEDIFEHNHRVLPGLARASVMYVLRCRGWSLQQIGEFLNREHSTVWSGVGNVQRRVAVDDEARELVDYLMALPLKEPDLMQAIRDAEAARERLDRALVIARAR